MLRDRPRPGRDREGIVREVGVPEASGQRLVVEDRDGARWSVECLGEPVEIGARVLFLAIGKPDLRQGEMTRLQDGLRREWVCTLRRGQGGKVELVPFAGLSMPKVVLDPRDTKNAVDGDRVVVVAKATARKPTARQRVSGRRDGKIRGSPHRGGLQVRVVENLGPAADPDSDHRAIVWKHRIARDFPRRARLEANSISDTLSGAELENRLDLRHLPFVTIDPASARDHDDAVFAEESSGSALGLVDASGQTHSARPAVAWTSRLWIAIADVAHFVRPGSAIDAEARRRANSFYFPDRAIPMLPERLSTRICSLQPDVDRLALVVELRIVEEGQVADALFHEAVIRSHGRLAYEEAADCLSGACADGRTQPVWSESLRCLDAITERFRVARNEAGALHLELPEIGIELDEAGKPVDAVVRERNRAHVWIEEAMLAANRAVAAAIDRAGRPTLHRVHPPPSRQKLAAFSFLLERLSLEQNAELDEPGEIARILESVRDTPLQERVHTAALRSMSQARYESDSRGHYALHFDHYLHFTSPIRRYADLDVHRALKRMMHDPSEGSDSAGRISEDCARLAIWLSGRERVAVEVERDAEALACCAILTGREGDRFLARIVSATEFGLFIRLESPAVSGLVPIRTLEGEWRLDSHEEALIGLRTGARLTQGDEIEVRLLEVDSDRGRLAFVWTRDSMRRRTTARSV